MTGPESHYTPAEEAEVWENWANAIAKNDPKLAEELVSGFIAQEEAKPQCENTDICGNTQVFRAPGRKNSDI